VLRNCESESHTYKEMECNMIVNILHLCSWLATHPKALNVKPTFIAIITADHSIPVTRTHMHTCTHTHARTHTFTRDKFNNRGSDRTLVICQS
jgi:hypothetical protein